MKFDLARMLESKRALRARLASLTIEEKLAMLDVLREREIAIRGSKGGAAVGGVREEVPEYDSPPDGAH